MSQDGSPRRDLHSSKPRERFDTDGRGEESPDYDGPRHQVRPRWSWSGLGLLVLGGIIGGVGVAVVSVPAIVVGALVLLAGAGAAVYGGLFYDIEAGSAPVSDAKREVPGASAVVVDDELQSDVASQERRLAAMRARPAVRPSLRRPAAGVLILVAVFLVVTQGAFYADDPTGRAGTLRATAAAIAIGLPALYLFQVRASLAASALCLLAGVGLVASALLADHATDRSQVSELLCGVLVLAVLPPCVLPVLRRARGSHRAARGRA